MSIMMNAGVERFEFATLYVSSSRFNTLKSGIIKLQLGLRQTRSSFHLRLGQHTQIRNSAPPDPIKRSSNSVNAVLQQIRPQNQQI